MARKRFTEDQIAQILLKAAYRAIKKLANKYGNSQRTLYRWRYFAENRPSLSKLIDQKKLLLSVVGRMRQRGH
jgi:transposase-like protein